MKKVPTPLKTTIGRAKRTTTTIEMVAKMAGVSLSTVSRILNGTAIVSPDKRLAIEDAIKALGFVPNPVARGLAGGKTYSIGVITQAIDSPFYGTSLRGIEDELDPAGYSPLFLSAHWDVKSEARCLETLRARRVDGIIVLTGRLPDSALKTCAKHLPIVVTGRDLKAPGLFAMNFDNYGGGLLATRHLVSLGHQRIVFISGDALHPDSNERLRGYRAALQEAGIAYDPNLVVVGDYNENSGLLAVQQLAQSGHRYTAIFAANDQMAAGAALGLHRMGLRVPQDVSLVGFDDLPTSSFTVPPLSTVHQSAYEQGRLSAYAMLQLITGATPVVEAPLPRFITRDSSGPAPR
jgi:LacI family transcriptional regulator